MNKDVLEKVVVWFSVVSGGDGSAFNRWYLTEAEAEFDQDDTDEPWGEPCLGSVETFIGSDIYNKALANKED